LYNIFLEMITWGFKLAQIKMLTKIGTVSVEGRGREHEPVDQMKRLNIVKPCKFKCKRLSLG